MNSCQPCPYLSPSTTHDGIGVWLCTKGAVKPFLGAFIGWQAEEPKQGKGECVTGFMGRYFGQSVEQYQMAMQL